MSDPQTDQEGQPGIASAALLGLCPNCGSRTLYDGLIRFAPRCRVCGLDIAAFNVGDGPAAFLTLVIGTVLCGLAIWLQLALSPPFWVHIVLWLPLSVLMVVGGLRVTKAWLLGAEYRRQAGEHRFGK